MIVNKQFQEIDVTVHFEIRYAGLACDDTITEESVKVKSFNALVHCLGGYGAESLRKEHEFAENITVSGITIGTETVDDTSMYIRLFRGQAFSGWGTVTIANADIENRLLSNLQQVKKIIDNTLEGYPQRY